MPKSTFARGIRVVAFFEGGKGLIVLVGGLGLLTLLHRDVHQLAIELIDRLHLDAARKYPSIFIDAAGKVTDAKLWMLAGMALAYSCFRMAEAYGLWKERAWAEWLAVATGLIYLPLEIYELSHGITPVKVWAVIANAAIVAFMAFVLIGRRKSGAGGAECDPTSGAGGRTGGSPQEPLDG